jgi:hypothetical protein
MSRKLSVLALALPFALTPLACQKHGEEPSTTTTTGATITTNQQGEDADDVSMTKQIKNRLQSDDALSPTAKNVDVLTNEGVVTLRGTVTTERERDEIELVARDVNNGRLVQNHLTVTPAPSVPSAQGRGFPPKRPEPLEDTRPPPINDKY